MKTAIEHLEQELEKLGVHLFDEVQEVIEQSKAMEKKEIKRAYTDGQRSAQFKYPLNAEQYHNEIFKSE